MLLRRQDLAAKQNKRSRIETTSKDSDDFHPRSILKSTLAHSDPHLNNQQQTGSTWKLVLKLLIAIDFVFN